MAISVDWVSGVITVPQADLTFVGGLRYELDADVFRLALKDLEASQEGIPYTDTHVHNTAVTLGGLVLARVVEVIPPYTITFEDGLYAVDIVGANTNILDFTNRNQVSIATENSAGLIEVGLQPEELASAVLDALQSSYNTPGTVGGSISLIEGLASTSHVSVAYNDITGSESVDLLVWATTNNVIIPAPTAMAITWRDSAGALLFSATESSATLSPQGYYSLNVPVVLVADDVYSVEVSVTTALGTFIATRSVSTS